MNNKPILIWRTAFYFTVKEDVKLKKPKQKAKKDAEGDVRLYTFLPLILLTEPSLGFGHLAAYVAFGGITG